MDTAISLGDCLSDLGCSPSRHERVINIINSLYDKNLTTETFINPEDDEFMKVIEDAIEEWYENEYSIQDMYRDD